MNNSELQSKLSEAFSAVLKEWAEDDLEAPIPLQVVFNALDDTKSEAHLILAEARDTYDAWIERQAIEASSFDNSLSRKCASREAEDRARSLK